MLTQVLDLISDGKLPVPDDVTCRESVGEFEISNAFEKFYRTLKELL